VTDGRAAHLERRVLVLVSTGRDAALTAAALERAQIVCACFADLHRVCDELDAGAAAILLAEEAVVPDAAKRLVDWLSRQPSWSDLPVLVLARPGAGSSAVVEAMNLFRNVTVLERPMRTAALVSAVRSALRARERQYQTREHLAERKRAEEALKEADRRKDEFLAILAHELRNPLAPIRNSLHILRLASTDDTSAGRVADILDRQVDHMVRLVDDLLEVSRITRGKIELRREPIELVDVLQSAFETSRPLLEAAGHEFTMTIPPNRLVVDADAVRLAQVFANLLNNAAKYTDAGGQIRLTVVPEGRVVAITVRDTGIGIPADMLPHVFELFAQVDHHASRSPGGLGIGLTLVRSLVEMHGGTVHARSGGAGHGSEFIVRLPLAPVQPVRRSKKPNDVHSAIAQRRVLVVDDNRDAAESLGMLLTLLGADVQVEFSGPAALDAIAASRPSVVLLDIGMPGMSGLEVARRVRQQPELNAVKLIALTGWGQEEDRRRSEMAGFDRHLVKPIAFEELEALLKSFEPTASRERADQAR
jgi:signal transduction histidine kinase/ActR/RegA family two-component response regulator